MERVKIHKLFGYCDVNLDFENEFNMKVYIGENGVGKTTILNILHSLLTGEVQKIINIEFEGIDVEIKNEKFSFKKQDMLLSLDLKETFKKLRTILRINLPQEIYVELKSFSDNDDFVNFYKKISKLKEQKTLSERTHSKIMSELLNDTNEINENLKENSWYNYLESLKTKNRKVMYFPTFRRIEEELLNLNEDFERGVFRGSESEIVKFDYNNPSIKMLKSGMRDVQDIIEKIERKVEKNSVDSFNKVTGDMMTYLLKEDSEIYVKGKYGENIRNIEKIEVILNRISNEHLSDDIKGEVLKKIQGENSNKEKSLTYFINKLLEYYEKQEQLEIQIMDFVKTCNKYLVNKEMVYDQAKIKIYIKNEIDGNLVELSTLSSGEKQIISIFTLIYLETQDENLFIMIDEPELSLSVLWQETLIEDMYRSHNVEYLIAVTHSPFIYEDLPEQVSENIERNYEFRMDDDIE